MSSYREGVLQDSKRYAAVCLPLISRTWHYMSPTAALDTASTATHVIMSDSAAPLPLSSTSQQDGNAASNTNKPRSSKGPTRRGQSSAAVAPVASPPSTEQQISYSAERIIGNGSFGVVFQAAVVETGEIVAIKKVLQDKRFKNRELQIMRQLVKDPLSNIVALMHCFFSQVSYPPSASRFAQLQPTYQTVFFIIQVMVLITYILYSNHSLTHRARKQTNFILI